MSTAEAERNLINWARYNGRRDEFVRSAHRAGVQKMRIHALTGISRQTIDRILSQPRGDNDMRGNLNNSLIEHDVATILEGRDSTQYATVRYETDESGIGFILKAYDDGELVKSYKVTLEEI